MTLGEMDAAVMTSSTEALLMQIGISFYAMRELASRFAQKIEGKDPRDLSTYSFVWRIALDFIAGNHGHDNDPSAFKRVE